MATVKDLDTRLDELEQALNEQKVEFREFKSEVKTLTYFGRWLAAFSAVAIFGMVGQTFAVARTAGALENQVAVHGQEITRLREKTEQLSAAVVRTEQKVELLSVRMDRLEQKVDAVADLLKQLQADLRRDRPGK